MELEQSTNSDDPYVEEGQPPAVIGKHPNESVRSQIDLHEGCVLENFLQLN